MGVTLLIGVFDSGIGGLSVLRALRAELPHEDFIYLADSGHAPYGERDVAHVLTRSRALAGYLLRQNVKTLVIACNTATAAAIDLLRAQYPQLPIIGVEPAVKPATLLSQTGRVGIMATRSTLESARFQTLLDSLTANGRPTSFVLQPCDGLADAIERSASTGDTTELIAACARHTGAMGRFGTEKGEMDTLVLGCTHYPFAEQQLIALLGDKVQLVATGEAVARQTRRQIASLAGLEESDRPGRVSLLSTGDPQVLQAAAARWLGLQAAVTQPQF